MKILKKSICILSVCILSCFLFSGCTYKKYELIGVVFSGDTKITPIAEISDQEVLDYLETSYNNSASIRLKQNGNFEMKYALSENGLTITYSQVGRFELDHKANTITFYTMGGDGKENPSTQQYTNNTIIFYDGAYHLAFK